MAETFSSKKYFANQENLNKYGSSQDKQFGTILDLSYKQLSQNSNDNIVPGIFLDRSSNNLENNTEYFVLKLPGEYFNILQNQITLVPW